MEVSRRFVVCIKKTSFLALGYNRINPYPILNMTFTIDNPVTWQYLEIDAQNQAKIANSRLSVSQLIQEKHAHGWSPEELHFQHPEISLAAIYSALSYYYTYQIQIDAKMTQEEEKIHTLAS